MSDSLPTETKAILCRKWTAMMPLHSEPHRGFWGQLHLQMRSLVTLPNASVTPSHAASELRRLRLRLESGDRAERSGRQGEEASSGESRGRLR